MSETKSFDELAFESRQHNPNRSYPTLKNWYRKFNKPGVYLYSYRQFLRHTAIGSGPLGASSIAMESAQEMMTLKRMKP